MGNNRDPRGRTNENLQDDIGEQAEASQLQDPNPEVRRALAPEGGVSGMSGTGQSSPHHGFEDRTGQGALGEPMDADSVAPMPYAGEAGQDGGTRMDREQQVRSRKTGGLGGAAGRSPTGAADPSPGTPIDRGSRST